MKSILFQIFALLLCVGLSAQDPHFSQHNQAHQLVNPALNGVFNGQWRLGVQYRDQQSALLGIESFKTMYSHFDSKINIKNEDFITYGLDVTRDVTGAGGLSQLQSHLSIGVIKQLSSNRYKGNQTFLSGSFQAGFGRNSVNWGDFWFGRQFDVNNGQVNPDLPTGEPSVEDQLNSLWYLDFGGGLLFYTVWDETTSFYFGGAGFHLNQPNITVTEGSDDFLYRRFVINAGGQFSVTRNLSLMPSTVFHFQGPSRMLLPGMQFRYAHDDWREIALRFGAFTRVVTTYDGWTNDAFILSSIFEYQSLQFGFSYDLSTSIISRANNTRGAFEISVQYRNMNTRYRKPLTCPQF